MALVLILIYKNKRLGEYFHVENWLKSINRPELRADFHKLVHWRLLKKKEETRNDGSNRNGFYALTEEGVLFAKRKCSFQEKVVLFNNKFESFEGPYIDIKKALGNKFNYNELINGL